MPKLNLGKVVGDKGDSFVFEDFTSDQLDGLTPKMLKGNVTTLDPDQNATVDIRKDGLNNYIDFGIPRGKNGSEIKSISAENVEMADGNTLESAMTAANESIAGIEEPAFDDTTNTYDSLAEYNTAAETASNAIQSHTSIFSTLSNMKKSLSAIVQSLNILGGRVGGIHGISSALDSEDENTAASSKAVSVLNSNLANTAKTTIGTATKGEKFSHGALYYVRNGMCIVSLESTPSAAVSNGDVVLNGLPKPYGGGVIYLSLQTANGNCYSAIIRTSGNLEIYFPAYTTASRIDTCFSYFTTV